MRDMSKKYLQGKDEYPDIGNFIHWFIIQQKVKKKKVAEELHILPTTLNGYFKQQSVQFGILWKISKIINYNMVADLGQRLKIPFETNAEKELKAQLAEKEELIKKMEIQLEVYREMRK